MRIGWGTPFSTRSAIGQFSLIVCEELRARGHDIDIIRLESEEERASAPIDCSMRIIHAIECDVDDYDVLVANFGNHAPFHAHVLSLLARRAPLGIFHDMEMRDFEWGLADRYRFDLPRLLGVAADLDQTGIADMVDPAARATLATLAAMTCGAIIHGPHYRATVAAFCPGPVKVVPLCYPDTGTPWAPAVPGPERRVTIFGVINGNKQVRRVLAALAKLAPGLEPVELHLVGAVEDRWRRAILAEAKEFALEPPVFHGYVSDQQLQDILESSHATCCLRYPVTEGGSASLVTALYRGRPLIVSDVASYALVPDDLLFKVSYGQDPGDLARALTEIFTNPEAANAKAARAQAWARDRFSAHGYVDALLPLLEALPRHDCLARTARQLVGAITAPDHEPVLPAISAFAGALDWMDAAQSEG